MWKKEGLSSQLQNDKSTILYLFGGLITNSISPSNKIFTNQNTMETNLNRSYISSASSDLKTRALSNHSKGDTMVQAEPRPLESFITVENNPAENASLSFTETDYQTSGKIADV